MWALRDSASPATGWCRLGETTFTWTLWSNGATKESNQLTIVQLERCASREWKINMGMNKKQSSLDSEKLVIKQSQTFQTNFIALSCRTAGFQGLEEERNGNGLCWGQAGRSSCTWYMWGSIWSSCLTTPLTWHCKATRLSSICFLYPSQGKTLGLHLV